MKKLLLLLLLMSCRQDIPVTDATHFCQQYRTCLPDKEELLSACDRIAKVDDRLRDAYVYDCKDLEPCAFVACMYTHESAKTVALRLTKEK